MGQPGLGAEEQATRRARRLAQLRDAAARGSEVDSAMLQRALADQRAWSVGAEGERQVAEVLTRLQRYGWTALHDVHWPGRPQANIDHIAIGPGGIVIIDAKNWSGTVTVRDGVLRQNGYQREHEVEGVAQATAAVTALLAPQHRSSVRGMLCLASQDRDPQWLPGTGVIVVGRWQLPEALLSLPPRLTVLDVADVARFLHRELAGERPRKTPGAQVPRQRGPRTRSPRATARTQSSRQARAGASARSLARSVLTIGGVILMLIVLAQCPGIAGGH